VLVQCGCKIDRRYNSLAQLPHPIILNITFCRMACPVVRTSGCSRRWPERTGILTDMSRGQFGLLIRRRLCMQLTDVCIATAGTTSDCDADAGVQGSHHYASTPAEAVRDVLQAGTDVDCGTFVPQNADSALNQSLINMSLVDARLANLMRVRFRLVRAVTAHTQRSNMRGRGDLMRGGVARRDILTPRHWMRSLDLSCAARTPLRSR
jgi:hypothetical protein